ncbi:RagB/SusD family nutrient uptake outer membrane protein [Bacteroides sp. UBA939]|uniref:RagB/SusD family nutrient uptake outer membrane protein n=1 Tax=Bacteroides sp. UBA939 TaxID=1946092 RepID=UPI0025C6097F|nr:RagB/SusD family nutrient uptake outer membrane protein [Bacteroides sp. UBA939]
MKKIITLFTVGALMLSGCDDLFAPAIENFPNEEQMYNDAEYARGILHNVYSMIPGYYDNSEYGTDDAVTNQPSNVYLQMATGAWTTSSYNPQSQWTNSFGAIQYINIFLKNVEGVKWSDDAELNKLFAQRLTGEAYGLRGMFYFYLLRAHAGFGENNELLGVPILTAPQTVDSDFNQPRASFQACVEQIYRDLSEAEKRLPYEYEDVSGTVPEDFRSITTDVGKYNTVMGSKARQLYNGIIARAFRTRMATLAASPVFQDASNTATWADAANAAAAVIDYKGGVSGIASDGIEYYAPGIVNNILNGANPDEILWRGNKGSGDNDQETQNFPPSLYGNGNMNPSQNLVDAFPMANGYPISDVATSGYDANNPYAGRDPRLGKYILYNGSTISEKIVTINTSVGNQDGVNVTENRSTRTGYYLRKRLRMDVNCNPSSVTRQPHYTPRIRYTEMYLDYAEAANEAWGPKNGNGRAYSAYDVIKTIRQRAGVGGSDDAYLEACAADKDKMRELIRNERRLELCFEGFRFWDIRRWKMDLNEPVYGINWSGNSYQKITVEERSYEDYMYCCPIPNSEILKYNNIIQNKGWK